ncbi:O-antigen ligase family protein [Rhodococcus sp. BP-332]|uniref:O-antigen ligase family protein n=1 Tax=Rhodococcus sp. BP-332 TaxID=2739447 RepID=UPI001C9BAF33|nr:O-antigen ligase family protein [Rhodococcus sp. BP-332]MBY6678731.1 O-antigen ligase family protein [Rhodococcus sp. BP-332]
MTPRGASLLVGILGAGVAVAVGLLSGSSTSAARLLAVGLIGMVVGVTVTLASPKFVYAALGFTLGGIPFAVIPGAGPAVLLLAVAVWAAMLTHPPPVLRVRSLDVMVALLLLVSFASVTQSATSGVHVTEFLKWAVATSLIFPLLRLDAVDLRRFGLSYVCGAAMGGGASLLILFFDRTGTAISVLSPIGYGNTGTIGTTLRWFEVGGTSIRRLAGTYIDPNVAGIFLFLGFALALALTRGWIRIVSSAVIGLALMATLSRSAILSVIVALAVYLAFQRLRTRTRVIVVAATLLGAAVALAIPAVNARFLSSFGSSDRGTDDRARALANFLPSMDGHWLFGRGWGALELIDEVAGYNANYVANTPLLTLYRGGIIVGVVFLALLLAALVIAYRRMRSSTHWQAGVIGAAFIGFLLVALQLDFPVVTNPIVTMVFSVFLALLTVNPTPLSDDSAVEPDHARLQEVPR